ncbi:MAG: copper resistance protein CopZ, partial [Oscillospiraceae bacterium]|nr:copper resistance protein CopZ [Oscillospiraceae bacterium]
MENLIIILIMIVILIIGVIATVKHFKGESDCCGGGSYKPKRKKLKNIKYKKKFKIEGMHCQNCKNRVE